MAGQVVGGVVIRLVTTKDGWKTLGYILLGIVTFLVLTVLLFLMPVIVLGSYVFPDNSTQEGVRIAGELSKAAAVDFTPLEEQNFQVQEQAAQSGIEGGSWTSSADISVDWDIQELLILYDVMYGTHTPAPMDFTDFCGQIDRMVNRQFGVTVTREEIPKEHEEDVQRYRTHYHFGYTARLKSFAELLEALDLTEAQKARANIMHQYIYNQEQGALWGNDAAIDFGDIVYSDGSTAVVYYNQKDTRWGHLPYGRTGTIARSACGPTSLAMVISSLKTTVTPVAVANWAAANGYYSEGQGSYHALIPAAAKRWDVPVQGMGKDWQAVVDGLAEGKLAIAIMGTGHFTSSGHFIVLRGVTADGKIQVADSVSTKRSGELWDAKIIVNEALKGAAAGGPFWLLG